MANGERFEVIMSERNSMQGHTRVIKDKKTGILYIFHGSDNGGGITPLLGIDGKPIIELAEK